MSKVFPVLLFAVSVMIAATAAFFSVKGIGLLFAGSFYPVVIMASSLEIGKLFAVSFLYRKWSIMPFMLRMYLSMAVLLLIAITSLGIFGFLSDAYQDTKNKVSYYETKILSLENTNSMLENQMKTTRVDKQSFMQQSDKNTDRYKQIYDDYVKQQNVTKQQLVTRRDMLDQAIAQLKSKSGGLFSNNKKKLEQLTLDQQPEREQINTQLEQIERNIKLEYDKFMSRVDDATTSVDQVTVDTDNLNEQIDQNRKQILDLQNSIHQTDIGSFKFIAQSLDVEIDTAVKWFILVIVIVFDPLAMCLIIGYNVYVSENKYNKYEKAGVIPEAGPVASMPKIVYKATEYKNK